MAFDGILSQIKSLFGLLVIIQLVWYMLKTIIHLSVGESGGYFTSPLHGLVDQYPPLFTFTSVNNNIVKYQKQKKLNPIFPSIYCLQLPVYETHSRYSKILGKSYCTLYQTLKQANEKYSCWHTKTKHKCYKI